MCGYRTKFEDMKGEQGIFLKKRQWIMNFKKLLTKSRSLYIINEGMGELKIKNGRCKMKGMSVIKKILAGLMVGALLVSFTLTSCKKEEKVIKIGAILPLTGSAAEFGESNRNGILIWKEKTPLKCELFIYDSKNDPKTALSIYHQFIVPKNISIIIGCMSSVCNALKPLIIKDNKALFAIAAAPGLTEDNDNIIKFIPTPENQAKEILKFLSLRNIKYNEICVVYINDDFGLGFLKEFEKLTDNKIKKVSFSKEKADIRSVVTKALSFRPAAVVLIGYGSVLGNLIKSLKENKFEGIIIGSFEIAYPKVINTAGEAMEGVYALDFNIDKNAKKYVTFRERYYKKFKKEPDLDALMAYEIAKIIEKVMQSLPINAKGKDIIKKAKENVKNYPSLLGVLSIQKNGNVFYHLAIKEFSKGKWVHVK